MAIDNELIKLICPNSVKHVNVKCEKPFLAVRKWKRWLIEPSYRKNICKGYEGGIVIAKYLEPIILPPKTLTFDDNPYQMILKVTLRGKYKFVKKYIKSEKV